MQPSADYFEPFGRRVLYFMFGAFLVIRCIPLCLHIVADGAMRQAEGVYIILFISIILLCGVGLMATAVRFRLTLTERTLTLRRAFRTRTINRPDISGCSLMTLQGITTLFVHSPHKKRAIMRIPYVFEDGEDVQAWLNGYR
jgi:hypothetical protein